MTWRAAAPLAAIALVAGALGCGGGDEVSFKEGYLAESGEIQAVGMDIGRTLEGPGSRSPAEVSRRLTDLAGRAQGSVDDLKELDPPEALADERDRLAAAVQSGAADLREMAAATRAGDRRERRAATKNLLEHSEEIRRARGRLNRLALKEE